MLKIGLLLTSLVVLTQGNTQEYLNCGTEQAIYQLYQEHHELLQEFLRNEEIYDRTKVGQNKSDQVYIIPVVFHILHENGPENISDAQVQDAIAILNRDMRKLNADTSTIIPLFQPLASDIKIEFRLAQLDPNGNCTNGIDRIYTSRTNWANDSAKINPWPREKYLNIWTAKTLSTGWAGYAYYPSATTGAMIMRDGIMILQDYIGSIGTSTAYKSRALTHEVGHWLDLGHPWNRTINISINVGLACGDDGVEDTPTTKGHTTCPNLYTPDCYNVDIANSLFTFNGVTTTSGKTDTTKAPSGLYDIDLTPFKSNGLSDNSENNGTFSFTKWDIGAPDGATTQAELTGTMNLNKYYEVTLSPKKGNVISITKLKFVARRGTNGPRNFAVRSSADNFAKNTAITTTNTHLSATNQTVFFKKDDSQTENGITASIGGYVNKETPITFRIYAWNAEDTLGFFEIDSVTIDGKVGVVENIQNHMEYSYCTNMFTAGQRDRMRIAVESPIAGRSNLWSPENLIATGVDSPSPCKPQANFIASTNRICLGSSITFNKLISNGTATSISWSFPGGSPSTSTLDSPVVKYNTPGTYAVTLTATNAQGNTVETKNGYITVEDNMANVSFTGVYNEPFENATILSNSTWKTQDLSNNQHTWKTATSGVNGSNCLVVDAFNSFQPDMDVLSSPSFDFSTTKPQSVSFKYATATRKQIGTPNDALKIYISTDCGLTWNLRNSLGGSTLVNNGLKKSPYIPDNSTVWTERVITLNNTYWKPKVMFKFEYVASDSSNNFYFDDFNVSGFAGMNNLQAASLSLISYPNPAKENITVAYNLPVSAQVELNITDLTGKTVYTENEHLEEAEEHEKQFARSALQLNRGVYLIQLKVNGNYYTQKINFVE